MDARIEPALREAIAPPSPLAGDGRGGAARRFGLSPINLRRWQNFKANRRGYWSLWIFLALFIASLFAEFIANDKPYYISFEGKSYFPALVNYPETTFGGDFETSADYRDPFLQNLITEKGGYVLWPPIRFSYDTHNLDLPRRRPRSQPGCSRKRNASRSWRRSSSPAAAISNTTGSAPTTRAATSSRA